jgi:hypothetical protein
MKRITVLVPLFPLLAGCPTTGIVCQPGTNQCGNGCADFSSDSRNCGACGQACFGTEVCVSGTCQCRGGTVLCNGQCVVLQNDPKNCGVCGNKCAAGQFCQAGGCGGCSAMPCDGGSCVDEQSDSMNCGGCGVVCPDSQSCRAGQCTWDLVAACLSTGQVVGLQAGSDQRGPLKPLGSSPISLARYGQFLLAADTNDARLVQAKLPSLDRLTEFNTIGRAANQVLVDPPYVYSVNSVSHTLQVLAPVDGGCPPVVQPDAGCAYATLPDGGSVLPLDADGGCYYPQNRDADAGCVAARLDDGGFGPLPIDDGGCFWPPLPPPPPAMPCVQGESDAGLRLITIGELDTGANSFPEAVTKASGFLWVALNGGTGDVLKVDVSNPKSPSIATTVHLGGLDLMPFDGGTSVAMPYWIAQTGGKLYLPLNNLNPVTYSPGGPGLLAVVDTSTLATSTIELGSVGCLNALYVLPVQNQLFVTCGGAATYDPMYRLLGVTHAGVAVVDLATGAKAGWMISCPAGDDGGCMPIQPSRLAVADGGVYVGDANGGRIFVADLLADGGLHERRGYAGAVGGPIQACGVDPMLGFSNVADILELP